MLNIISLMKKKEVIRGCNYKGESIRVEIRNLPANKEWVNSVYSFNKNTVRFLPGVHNYVFNFLKSYFNSLSKNLEEKKTNKMKKTRRYSTEKIWISTPEIKHLAEKLYITVYTYNRIYNLYKKKLNLLEFDTGSSTFLTKKNDKKLVNKISVSANRKIILKTNNIYVKSNAVLKNITESAVQEKYKNIPKGFYNMPLNMKINTYESWLRHITTNNKTSEFVVNNKFIINNTYNTANNSINIKIKNTFNKFEFVKSSNSICVEKKLHYSDYTNFIKWIKLDKLAVINQYKSSLLRALTNKEWKTNFQNLKAQRYNYLINQFKKELAYISLKQKMLFNQFKFNELYLTPIIEFLQTIYKKKVIINIVALKYYYLNSSILSQIIVAKMKNPKHRGRSIKVVDGSISSIRIPVLGATKLPRIENKYISMQNIILDNFETKNEKLDYIEQFLLIKKAKSNRTVHKSVLKNLENKVVAGIFIKISGRLTKRYKAQRAVSRLRSKGTLKNVYSAHKGFASKISRGFSNINVEKTMMHSKTRVGAYGLTGWIASY